MKHFSGRVAFVTGGASGIGYGLVQELSRAGHESGCRRFQPGIPGGKQAALAGRKDVRFVYADAGDRDQVRAAADEAISAFGKIHVLCNNAGVGGGGDTHEPDFEAWDRALRINLGGVVNGVKLITPLILSHGEGGHIVKHLVDGGIVPLPLRVSVRPDRQVCRTRVHRIAANVARPARHRRPCLFPGGTRTRIVEASARTGLRGRRRQR